MYGYGFRYGPLRPVGTDGKETTQSPHRGPHLKILCITSSEAGQTVKHRAPLYPYPLARRPQVSQLSSRKRLATLPVEAACRADEEEGAAPVVDWRPAVAAGSPADEAAFH